MHRLAAPLPPNSGDLYSAHLKAVVSDVVFVRVRLPESLLVVPHEIVDVQVLSLFDFVDADLCPGRRQTESGGGSWPSFSRLIILLPRIDWLAMLLTI